MSPQTERTGNKTSRNLNRRRTDFSTDCAFLNSKVGTYDLHPPHQLRGRLRTDTRGDILDSYESDNEQGPRTSTATKFDTYGSSQDIETRLRRYHRIRQQGPRPDYNDLGTDSSTSSPRKASVGQAARIWLQLEPVDTSQDSSGSALQYFVIEL